MPWSLCRRPVVAAASAGVLLPWIVYASLLQRSLELLGPKWVQSSGASVEDGRLLLIPLALANQEPVVVAFVVVFAAVGMADETAPTILSWLRGAAMLAAAAAIVASGGYIFHVATAPS